MPTAGPNNAGTAANDMSTGFTAWTSTANAIGAVDAAYAPCTYSAPSSSQYLALTNFGFAVPGGATINGITVALQKKKLNSGDDVIDFAARLIKAGTVQSTDRSAAGQWPTTAGSTTYGGASDLWGGTWTASDVNGSGFGFAIAAGPVDTITGSGTAQVDAVAITIDYTAAGGAPGRALVSRRIESPSEPQFAE